MDVFSNRRDVSEKGLRRRQKFDRVLVFLVEQGLSRAGAKAELLKFLRTGDGRHIDLLIQRKESKQ